MLSLETGIITALVRDLKDIRHNAISLQKLSSQHLNELFLSMKNAQILFLKSLDKKPDELAEISFPTEDWTTV